MSCARTRQPSRADPVQHSAEFSRCLVTCDVVGIRRLWKHVAPHLPQPGSDRDALVAIHHARTQAKSISLRLRAYSHRWLLDNGYPSGLPDELKPRAERMYPKVVEGVGIAVKAGSALMQPIAPIIRGAMEDVVREAYADGKTDPVFVKGRMLEARKVALKKLMGG